MTRTIAIKGMAGIESVQTDGSFTAYTAIEWQFKPGKAP